LGFLAGRGFTDVVAKYAQPLASLLLFALGAKMLFGAFWHRRRAARVPARLTLGSLLVQSVATSIDALSVGVGLALINSQIPLTALCIASIAFLSCYAGFTLGRRFGVMLARRAMTAGGILLLLIGLYILFAQHLQGL
jgi:putative Mn2+ efflux pump MntP